MLSLAGCALRYSPAHSTYAQHHVNQDSLSDRRIDSIVKPFRDSLTDKMNLVIGKSEMEITKAQPESTLGNFCADIFLAYARSKVHHEVIDACIINYGGIRLPGLPAGEITVGKIFELLPFDNLLVVNKVSGDSLQKACDAMAKAGGWPVSGIRFTIVDGKAVDVTVGDHKLSPSRSYFIALSDYVANGGDNMSMLVSSHSYNTGILMRDAMIDFIRQLDKPISSQLDGRIAKHE